MTKDTTKSVEERSARHLVARICEGMVENILGANGATPEGIKVLKNGIMQQMLREKSQ